MAQYVIYVYVRDFEGNKVTNEFYVSGIEASFNMYKVLRDSTNCIGLDLVDCETGEVIEYDDFENETEEPEDYFDEDFEEWCKSTDVPYPDDIEEQEESEYMPYPEEIDPDFLAYLDGFGFGIWLL